MVRTHGRAPKGQRVIAKQPHGHWHTNTLIAALRLGGVIGLTLVDGSVSGDVFEAFVEQVLIYELFPGYIVVMDNLSSHQRPRIRELIESVGTELRFRPRCSPDLNPLEMVFSKIKRKLRVLACRTKDTLWRAIQPVLDTVTCIDVWHCFEHYGRVSS
jgi:transposase